MLWYAFMFNKERDEEFEYKLNMTEYLASFTNSEGVRQVKEAREKKKSVTDEDFDQILRDKFGRDLDANTFKQPVRTVEIEEPVKVVRKKKGSISLEDLERYAGLDTITYKPNKKQ